MDQPISVGGATQAAAAYPDAIRAAAQDPRQLETLYQSALAARETGPFASAMLETYREQPDNLLFAAWYYRLQQERPSVLRSYLSAHWRLATGLAVVLGLAYWVSSDPSLPIAHRALGGVPVLAVVWAPLAALAIMVYLVVTTGRGLDRALVSGAVLVVFSVYGLALLQPPRAAIAILPILRGEVQQTYLLLLLLHLPLLSAAAVAVTLLGRWPLAEDRFAFLAKGIETVGTAGVASIVGGIFVGLTYGIFAALSVEIPNVGVRLLLAGGGGLIPVLAVASVYDPSVAPTEQDFRRGFGRLQVTLLRALLPLTLLVLAIYLVVIPFNFRQPFFNRDTLIVYNVLLFAIVGLLVGVTPVSIDDVPARMQRWLRAGIVALAALTALIGLYALAAVLYRTSQGALTMNRLAVIGWDVLNFALLAVVLIRQARSRDSWVHRLYGALSVGTTLYVAWGAALVFALPWLFG